MAYTHYDRLTALDTSFLDLESPGVHMHVGSVGIFDAGPLAQDGGIDFAQVLGLAEAGLKRAPRFLQKLARMPVTGHPVWIDDEHFNLRYHVRHTALPFPGDERRLKRLVGRVMSQKLDRSKPMWELWVVEGLEGGQFAVISKVHHCVIDGISGVDLLSAFMGPDESYRANSGDYRFLPRPAPGPLELLGDELRRRATLPFRAAAAAARTFSRDRGALESAAQVGEGFMQALSKSLSPSSQTSLNVPIGPHRRFDWTRFDLGTVREVKKSIGGTVNDVVLLTVSGALRRFLGGRGDDLAEADIRALVPVSTRAESQRGTLGNRVSMLVAPLPVDEPDLRRRARRVVEETGKLKGSGQSRGTEVLEELSDWTATGLLTRMSRMAASRRSFNVVVTNVPGPQYPVYMAGARLLESYPLVPLFENQALGIALFSYDGGLYWGFNADWDAVPDLHDFVLAIEHEFEAIRAL